MVGTKLHADDTPVPVLDPGRGRTKTGRLWSRCVTIAPPAAFYRYGPDRKGERPQAHLQAFTGVLQADADAGFAELHRKNRLLEATASPIAEGALTRIAALYEIEERARGRPPDERRHRAATGASAAVHRPVAGSCLRPLCRGLPKASYRRGRVPAPAQDLRHLRSGRLPEQALDRIA